MSNRVGQRATFGVVVPATNTVVEHDFHAIGPRDVTFHTGRIPMGEGEITTDEEFEALMEHVNAATDDATARAAAVAPDHMIMGMSSETFWDGVEGNDSFEARIRDIAGTDVTTGATATEEALSALDAEQVAFLTPYQPVGDSAVRQYAEEVGFNVEAIHGLRCESATAIADVEESTLISALREIQTPELDAIVQVGTNLSMLHIAAEADRWLGTPTIAINEAILWHALRTVGITDQFNRAGPLLRNH
jgi:maleate isomerase